MVCRVNRELYLFIFTNSCVNDSRLIISEAHPAKTILLTGQPLTSAEMEGLVTLFNAEQLTNSPSSGRRQGILGQLKRSLLPRMSHCCHILNALPVSCTFLWDVCP